MVAAHALCVNGHNIHARYSTGKAGRVLLTIFRAGTKLDGGALAETGKTSQGRDSDIPNTNRVKTAAKLGRIRSNAPSSAVLGNGKETNPFGNRGNPTNATP